MTTQENTANPFEFWREMFQKSTEAWAQAAGPANNPFRVPFFGAAPGAAAPGFDAGSAFNPFAQFMPSFSTDMQQMWEQFYNSWSEQAKQAMASGAPGRRSSSTLRSSGRNSWRPWRRPSPR